MADGTRNTSNTRIYPTANTEAAMSSLYQLRGGTSGVHARNFSDFEPEKFKNRSFFNKYKESKKNGINTSETINLNQRSNISGVNGMTTQLNQSGISSGGMSFIQQQDEFNMPMPIQSHGTYKRPRTNSPFPQMRSINLQYQQFNQEVIDKLNQSENLVLKQITHNTRAFRNSNTQNSNMNPYLTEQDNINSGPKYQFVISPQQMSYNTGMQNNYDEIRTPSIPISQQISLNNSLQNTATNSNAKAFFETNDPKLTQLHQSNQPQGSSAYILSPNQIKFHKKQNNIEKHHQGYDTASGIISRQQLNNINANHFSQKLTDKISPNSRNQGLAFEFQKSQQRSLSTKQSNNQSRNFVQISDQNLGSQNLEAVEAVLNKNIKLEPIHSAKVSRQLRNKSFNDGSASVIINSNIRGIAPHPMTQQKTYNAGRLITSGILNNNIANKVNLNNAGIKGYESINNAGFRSPSKNNIKELIDGVDTLEERNLPHKDLLNASKGHIYRTADKRTEDSIFNDPNASFRVENRKARPKIIKNINNICNIFIFQNSSLTNSTNVSQERKKRVSSLKPSQNITQNLEIVQQNTQPLPLYQNDKLQIPLSHDQNKSTLAVPKYLNSGILEEKNKDQYYFTFFKDNPNHNQPSTSYHEMTTDSITERAQLETTESANESPISRFATNIQLFPQSRQNDQMRPDTIFNSKGLAVVNNYDAQMIINSVTHSNAQFSGNSSVHNNQDNSQATSSYQPRRKLSTKKPQSPKKNLPACFLDVQSSTGQQQQSDKKNSNIADGLVVAQNRHRHQRMNSETPHILHQQIREMNEFDLIQNQSQKPANITDVNNSYTQSQSNITQMIMKNNKIYIPQKIIHKLNERTLRTGTVPGAVTQGIQKDSIKTSLIIKEEEAQDF
eukprot:403339873